MFYKQWALTSVKHAFPNSPFFSVLSGGVTAKYPCLQSFIGSWVTFTASSGLGERGQRWISKRCMLCPPVSRTQASACDGYWYWGSSRSARPGRPRDFFILHLTKILPTRAQGSEIIHENEAFRLSPTLTTTTKMEIFNEDPTYNTPAPLFPSDHNLWSL
jgi:hypothetical protein